MAIARKLQVSMDQVFPAGAFLVGQVEAVLDFKAAVRPDGSRPQQVDLDSGLLVWSCPVLDADPEAANRDKAVVVKLLASHQPVPPANKSGLPFTPVRFEGLSLTAWVDDRSGGRPRVGWSIRATGLAEESAGGRQAEEQGKAA